MNEQEFISELEKINITLTKIQLNQLKQFYKILIEVNQSVNLTRITEKEEVYEKHFYDSLTLSKVINLNEVNTLLDIGTGAGFPGLVLKIVYPNLKITLIDSLQKRVNFLNRVINDLQLKDIEALHVRAEDYQNKNIKYDLVVSRAVARLPKLLKYSLPFVDKEGLFIAMKANLTTEIEESQSILKSNKFYLQQIESFTLPKEKSVRNLVVVKRK